MSSRYFDAPQVRNQQDSTFSLTGSGRPRPEVAPVAEVEEPPMAQEVNIHMMVMFLMMMEVNIYDGHSQTLTTFSHISEMFQPGGPTPHGRPHLWEEGECQNSFCEISLSRSFKLFKSEEIIFENRLYPNPC